MRDIRTVGILHLPLGKRHLDVVAGKQRSVGEFKLKHFPPSTLLLILLLFFIFFLLLWSRWISKDIIYTFFTGWLCTNKSSKQHIKIIIEGPFLH